MSSKEVAAIILEQMGGNRFINMTGAKHFTTSDNDLSFRIPNRKVSHVRIVLTASNTYDVTFTRIYGRKVTTVGEFSGIHCDELQPLFTRETGLNTHL